MLIVQPEHENLRMPAEWEPQAATWLAWPHNTETWPRNLPAAQHEFCQLALTIAECQPVKIIGKQNTLTPAGKSLIRSRNIEWIEIPTNDAWIRDYGPTFVRKTNNALPNRESAGGPDNPVAGIDWRYNGWGEKYPPFDADQAVAQGLVESLGIRALQSNLCVEGGAIDIDGAGRLMTTESCLLNSNRNPGIARATIEQTFSRMLGVREFIWLPGGDVIAGDDTDGHIDQLARFVGPDEIVFATCKETNLDLARNEQVLRETTAKLGINLTALVLPAERKFFGRTIPASYCNFLLTNEQVIVPQFDCLQDTAALEILQSLRPERTTIGLPSLNLSVGLGSFHCLSQQQPA